MCFTVPMSDLLPPPPATIAVWTGLNRASAAVRAAIESALQAASLPPLDWYDALWEIEKSAPGGIRPFALQERLLLPQYGLSRLIERLVKAGYVERRACDGDGRGQMLHLSPQGALVRAAMWPVYARTLSTSLNTRLSEAEALTLARLLQQILP